MRCCRSIPLFPRSVTSVLLRPLNKAFHPTERHGLSMLVRCYLWVFGFIELLNMGFTDLSLMPILLQISYVQHIEIVMTGTKVDICAIYEVSDIAPQ